MTIIHCPTGTLYRDSQFNRYIMDDFGNTVLFEGTVKEQSVNFMLTAFVFNKGDIGH